MSEKPKMDYSKMSITEMTNYLVEKHSDDKELIKGFVQAANPHIEKDEKGKSAKKYNVKSAKRYFYNNLKNEIQFENPPREKRVTTWETMENWISSLGIELPTEEV